MQTSLQRVTIHEVNANSLQRVTAAELRPLSFLTIREESLQQVTIHEVNANSLQRVTAAELRPLSFLTIREESLQRVTIAKQFVNESPMGERCERCRRQMKRAERVAAVEKIEESRKPDDFFGYRNRIHSAKQNMSCWHLGVGNSRRIYTNTIEAVNKTVYNLF